MYYVVGFNPSTGATMSVAVYSKKYGAALFLAPATRIIEDLIGKIGELGGSNRIPVGNGDFYLIYTPSGTFALVRDQKVRADKPDRAQPYTMLPPPVFDDWLLEMEAGAQWLWVYGKSADVATGRERFRLVLSAIRREYVSTIEYDRASGQAFRMVNGRWIPNRASGNAVPASEVRALARTAK
jgi:hypothetical protein